MHQLYTLLLLVFGAGLSYADHDFIYRRAQSLYPPYVDSSLKNKFWDYGGDVLINTYSFVQLTDERPNKSGWAFSNSKLNATHWSVEFQFAVGKDGGKKSTSNGDGFAFWYTQEPFTSGTAFGYNNRFKGLGVFFDTYPHGADKSAFPMVAAMVGDGNLNYDANRDGANTRIGYCSIDFRNKSFSTRAKVSYVLGTLEVLIDVGGDDAWKSCIKVDNVQLPAEGYIGFTASTGQATDVHKIYSVTAIEIMPGGTTHDYTAPDERVAKSGSSYFTYFVFIGVVGIIGYYLYRAQKPSNKY